MRNKLLILTAFTLLLLAGAFRLLRSRSSTPTPVLAPTTRNSSPIFPPLSQPTADEPDNRPAVSPGEMRFLLPEHRQAVLILDSAIRRLPDPGWTQRPGERYAPVHSMPTRWEGIWRSPSRDVAIVIHNTTSWAEGFELSAARRAAEQWSAALDYSRSAEDGEERHAFHFHLLPPRSVEDRPADFDRLRLSPGDAEASLLVEEGSAEYRVRIRSRESYPVAITPAGIRAYLDSPESFRQAALAELGHLHRQGGEQTRSGLGFQLSLHRAVPGGVFYDESDIPNHIRQKAGRQLDAGVEAQRNLVEAHYPEMHAALVEVLPDFRTLFSDAAPKPHSAADAGP